jgi:3-oxoacyl-[acyl-carrier protein] reductase
MDLKGKTVLITGGGTGLGRAIALQFAAAGADVAINYSKSASDAEATVAELKKLGVRAEAFKADVSDTAKAEAMVRQVAERFLRLDILVNNAGTTKVVPFKDLDGLAEEDWTRLFRVNAMSNFFIARAAVPFMKKGGSGHIINTVSVAGLKPSGSSIAYAVSKAAQIHTTKCLALALAPEIKVNGVAPGILLTRWADGFPQGQLQKTSEASPLKKSVDVEECASMYISIARNDSMTGHILVVDSGQTL